MGKLKYAVHAYAWTNSWSNDNLDIIDRAKGLGFDLVEVPLMEIEKVDAAAIKARAARVGMALCTSTACSEATDPTGEDQATRDAALRYLKACIKATADMGATVFTGVTYRPSDARLQAAPAMSIGNAPPRYLKRRRFARIWASRSASRLSTATRPSS